MDEAEKRKRKASGAMDEDAKAQWMRAQQQLMAQDASKQENAQRPKGKQRMEGQEDK